MAQPNLQNEALIWFDQLAEMSSQERDERLRALRLDQSELATLIDALLRADQADQGPLDQGVQKFVDQIVEPEAATEPIGESRMRVGPFLLLHELGKGGMGEVWLAERRDGEFVQRVALKLLKRGMDSDAISARFMQERRILASLNHPHIARFIDGGVSEAGRLYFAMEHIEGDHILTYASKQKLKVKDRVRLMIAVCDAVAYAQSHLVVHRDLKPSNILVDQNGQPRILDFGIAKLIHPIDSNDTITQSGLHLLSPAYAAPEQVLSDNISTATDVYSLGVILYELLTGVRPYQRDGVTLEKLAEQIRKENAPAPSQVIKHGDTTDYGNDSSRAKRDMIGDLDTLVLAALRFDAKRRYGNAAALAEDLRRWLDARPIAAQADTKSYRLRKFIARNRFIVGSASTVLLALIAGFGVALWQANEARKQTITAQLQTRRAEAAAQLAIEAAARTRRVKDFMMQTFIATDPIRQSKNASKTLTEALDEAIQRIDTEISDDAKLQIDLFDDFSEIRINQGRFEDAKKLNHRALVMAEKQYPANSAVIAEALLNRSSLVASTGQVELAAPDVERAVKILQSSEDAIPSQLVVALNSLSVLRNVQGRYAEAVALSQQALELARRDPNTKPVELFSSLHNVASNLIGLNRYDEAEAHSREAITIIEKQSGDQSGALSYVLSVLGQIVYRRGDLVEYKKISERLLQITQDNYPADHPNRADGLLDMAHAHIALGEKEKAKPLIDEAVALLEKIDSSRLVFALRDRALFYRSRGDLNLAWLDIERAHQTCKRQAEAQLICLVVRANRAGFLAEKGDGETALGEVEAVIETLGQIDAMKDNEYPQALEAKAKALAVLNRPSEALAAQELAIERYIDVFGKMHPDSKRAIANLKKYPKAQL